MRSGSVNSIHLPDDFNDIPPWLEVTPMPVVNRISYRCLECNVFIFTNADYAKHERRHRLIEE